MERINERVKRIMEDKNMSGAELGRRINRHTTSIQAMLKRKTMSVSLLENICKALEYNFFRELAEKLPYKNPLSVKISKRSLRN
jgi:DNA-binding Xre family transcriptional regulator